MQRIIVYTDAAGAGTLPDVFREGKRRQKVALICSGDAGIYGMASLMLEIGKLYDDCIIEVIPGITAASSGAAVLGAPLNHDFCVISLSDLLTPWERIKKRLIAAAEGDFAMAIYNPSSHKRADYLERACRILMEHGVEPERACGYVENIGRDDTKAVTLPMEEAGAYTGEHVYHGIYREFPDKNY